MDENYIYQELKNRNENILGVLFAYYERLFYNVGKEFLGIYGNDEDIAECIVDTLYYVWCHTDDFDSEKSSLKNWILMVFKSRIINLKRKNMREYEKTLIMAENQKYIDAEERTIHNEDYNELIGHIDNLKSPQSEIVMRRYVHEETTKEISENMEIPMKKLYYHLRKGKEKLKQILMENGINF